MTEANTNLSTPLRNVDIEPGTAPGEWPAEAVQTVIERGSLSEWRTLAAEIRRSPWGRVARVVEGITSWAEHPGLDEVFVAIITDARQSVVANGRNAWAKYVRQLRADTGLSMREFAALAGTSASRLSDYENGRVSPTTDALARLSHAAEAAGLVV